MQVISSTELRPDGEALRIAAATHLAAALQALNLAGFGVLAARTQHVLEDLLDEPAPPRPF